MVLGRFKDAVSDMAETIRRAFQDPPCRTVSTPFAAPGTAALRSLEAACRGVVYAFEPGIGSPVLTFPALIRQEAMGMAARLCREDAWAAWAAGAKVCEMPVFLTSQCSRLAVPALPRTVPVRNLGLPPFRTSCRAFREVFRTPGVQACPSRLGAPRVRRDLETVLALPIAIPGEDFQKLPRALNMRYTFQLVKATGENIRNLDVLGVYLVPVSGVASLRHDARTGRILVNLGPEAIGAVRKRFLLARRKDDRAFVSCFVED